MDPIDRRMQSFVEWFGEVPVEAKRMHDFEAREHSATWVRRNVGLGVVHGYVIAYRLAEKWWTLFFDRIEAMTAVDPELWRIEGYNCRGQSRIDTFFFWPGEGRWRHTSYRKYGDKFGRYRCREDSVSR